MRFFWGAVTAIAAKLWLTSEIRIVPVFADHDASNYVDHARAILAGAWFGGYSDLTLIKEPFYPIYLAFVQEAGLTLPLANSLIYAAACALACLAVRPLIRSEIATLGVFVVLLFNPMTYAWSAWLAMRSELNDSLALAAVACALGILVRRRLPLPRLISWWLGLGCAFAAFWLTREEAIWLVPALVVILGLYAFAIRQDANVRTKLAAIAIPVALWLAFGAAIAKMNENAYGWNTVVETKAPEFVSAYNSFVRIVPPHELPLITVPRSSREIAYRVSPAAKELEPALEGPLGAEWTSVVCRQIHVCNDIAGSYFMWAFRDAVAAAGHYTSGAEARSFYIRLAGEIDRACDSAAIVCRAKAPTIFPNPTWSQVPAIIANFREGVAIVTTFSQFSLAHPVVSQDPLLDDDYAFIVGTITHDRTGFRGWLATDRPMPVTIESQDGVVPIDGALRLPSTDVAAQLRRAGLGDWDDRNARFSLRSDCRTGCFIVVTDAQSHQTRIPLDAATRDFATARVRYHLDTVESPLLTYDNDLKQGILGTVAWLYELIVPVWVVLGAALLVARAVRAAVKRRITRPRAPDVLSVAVMASGACLILLLAVLIESYSAGFSPEYLGSFVPLMLFALGASTALDALTAYRFLRPRISTLSVRAQTTRTP